MIVYNPIINIGVITLLGIALVILTTVTYWKATQRLNLKRRLFLLGSRLAASALLIVILLQPSIEEKDPLTENEVSIGLAIDNSKSMRQNDIDGQERIDFARIQVLDKASSGDVPLKFFSFAKSAQQIDKQQIEQLKANQNNTLFLDSLKSILSNQESYGMKALVLMTDGHNFQDSTAQAMASIAKSHHCRLFALPIGNEGKVRDLDVNLTASQDYVFKGDKIALSASVYARSCEQEDVELQLFRNGKLIKTEKFNLGVQSSHLFQFEEQEEQNGLSEYEVKVTKLSAEVDVKNNQSSTFVNCLDKKIRVLLLEGEPHWESSFLRRYLQKNQRFELDSFTQFREGSVSSVTHKKGTALPQSVRDFRHYDLVLVGRRIDDILKDNGVKALRTYVKEMGGVLMCMRGNAFDSELGSSMQPVIWDQEGFDNVQLLASYEGKRLSLFKELDEEQINTRPRLDISRKVAQKRPLVKVLATTEDDYSDESQALIYRRYGKGQVVSLGAEGFWHWRFNKHYDTDNDHYSKFWNQTILWLILNTEFIPGSRFSFRQDISSVELGDKVNFRFSVRHNQDIPQTHPQMTIQSMDGESYKLDLAPASAEHRFIASFEPPSEGKYTVSVKDPAGEEHTLKFMCQINSMEEKEVDADVEFLAELTQSTGGRLISTEDLANLDKLVYQPPAEQTQQRSHLRPIWDKVLLMYLIVFLLGLDWFYRRRWGLS